MNIFGLTVKETWEYALGISTLLIIFAPLFALIPSLTGSKISWNRLLKKIQDVHSVNGSDPVLVALPVPTLKKYPFLLSTYKPALLVYHPESIKLQIGEESYIFERDSLSLHEDLLGSVIITYGSMQFLVKTVPPLKTQFNTRTSREQLQGIKQLSAAEQILCVSGSLLIIALFCRALDELQILSYTYPFVQTNDDLSQLNFLLISVGLIVGLLAFLVLKHKGTSMLLNVYVSILFGLSFYLFGGIGMFPLLIKAN
ncbi:MAG: hypothetical protein ABL903_09265 [Methylococcales bacterium]